MMEDVRQPLLDDHFKNIPANFRLYFPLDTSSQTAEEDFLQKFREAVLGSQVLRDMSLPYVQGGIDHWVAKLREVLRDGI